MKLTLEEAGEIVLRGEPWEECFYCRGRGKRTITIKDDEAEGGSRTESNPCSDCDGAGFFLPSKTEKAYQLVGVEVLPKPLTATERFAQTAGSMFRGRFNAPSLLRTVFHAHPLEKEPDDT